MEKKEAEYIEKVLKRWNANEEIMNKFNHWKTTGKIPEIPFKLETIEYFCSFIEVRGKK